MLHSSFVADSVSVNKEAETDALLDWKVSLQNQTQPPCFYGLSLLIMQPILLMIKTPAQSDAAGSAFLAAMQEV